MHYNEAECHLHSLSFRPLFIPKSLLWLFKVNEILESAAQIIHKPFSLHAILANDFKQPKRPHITFYTVHCTLNVTNYLSVWHWPMPLSCRLCLQVLIVLKVLIQLLFNPPVDRNCFELEQVKKVIIWCHYKLWFTCKSWNF